MKAFGNNAEMFKFSQKLNNLDDDNLFLIAASYEAEVFDKKVYTINSIINKIKTLSKEEFVEFDKQIDEILKKKDEKELIKKNENIESEIQISDRIFFLFSPKVNVNNAKLFYFLPLNVAITIYSMMYIHGYLIMYYDSLNILKKDLPDIYKFQLCFTLILFISMTNGNSSFAKISLFYYEIKLINNVIIIIARLDFNPPEFLIECILLYMSYIQLIVAKDKENKKLKER